MKDFISKLSIGSLVVAVIVFIASMVAWDRGVDVAIYGVIGSAIVFGLLALVMFYFIIKNTFK